LIVTYLVPQAVHPESWNGEFNWKKTNFLRKEKECRQIQAEAKECRKKCQPQKDPSEQGSNQSRCLLVGIFLPLGGVAGIFCLAFRDTLG